MRTSLKLVILALATSALACNTLLGTATPAPGECDVSLSRVSLTENDDGAVATLNQGDRLAVSLDSNPTTGFEWTVGKIDTTRLKYEGSSFSGFNPALVGSGGTQSLCFAALAAGGAELRLYYHRPWETGVPPLKTFAVTVEIE